MDPLHFDAHRILRVPGADFYTLATTGTCAWPPPLEDPDDRPPPIPEPGVPCLALDGSRSDYFMTFKPEEDLRALLHGSRVVRSLPDEGRLVATAEESLAEVIDRRRGHAPAGPARAFLPTAGRLDPYGYVILERAETHWRTEDRLFGMLSLCKCGIGICGSTHAWLERGLGLLVVEVDGASLACVEVGPFTLAEPGR